MGNRQTQKDFQLKGIGLMENLFKQKWDLSFRMNLIDNNQYLLI